ncbi:MAG: iron ABC transporter permease [Desulfobacteraceae bacterium]|nr:iron ABC transporter permease [Desulfobacteraceae bacterium]
MISQSNMKQRIPFILALLLGAIIFAFLIVPVMKTISSGFVSQGKITGYWFYRVVTNPILLAELGNGLMLALATTGVCLLLSVPLAVLRTKYTFRGMGILSILVLVPLILPPFVGAVSMKRLLGQFGVFNLILEHLGLIDISRSLPPDWLGSGFAGVVILQSLHLFPILYLNASAALANVDPAYNQAARNLGASAFRSFFRITLPMIRPGLFAGGTIVFIWAFTDIGTPAIMGYNHLTPVTIFQELANAEINPRTYSLVFIMLSSSVVFYVLGKFLFGRGLTGESTKASVSTDIKKLGLFSALCAWMLFGGVIFLSLLPHIGVLFLGLSDFWVNTILPERYTFKHLSFVIQNPDTLGSILNSLKYAGFSTALDVILGTLAAWLIVRAKIQGKTILDGLCMLPLAVPGMILAAGYVAMTASGTWLESIGPTRNPFIILVIAYAIRRLPFVVRGVSAGLQQIPESMEEAARNLGASTWTTGMRITLPLIAANMIAASVLTFSFAMLEVSDSLILAQTSEYYPITKQIYRLATSTGSPDAVNQAAAMGIYGMGLLGTAMGVASLLLGKRLGMIFRA